MRSAIDGVDVIGEAEDIFRIAVVVLQRDFHGQRAAVRHLAITFEIDRLFVQHRLAAIQVLDEFRYAAAVMKLVLFGGFHPLIGERDREAFVQERQLAQAAATACRS